METFKKLTTSAFIAFLLIGALALGSNTGHAAIKTCTPNKNLVLFLDARDLNSYSGSGTTWTDISGCGRNATLVGGPTFANDSSNQFGTIIFASKNTPYQYAYTQAASTMKTFTVETFYKFDTVTSGTDCTAIISDSLDNSGTNINFQIGTATLTTCASGIYGGAWTSGWVSTGAATMDTSWHTTSLVATDVGSGNSTLQLFNDGVANATISSSINLASSNSQINIAKRWDDGVSTLSDFMNGRISVIKIIDKTLTSTEVNNEYLCISSAPKPYINITGSPSTIRKLGSNQSLIATSNCPGSTTFYFNNRAINRCSNITNVKSGSSFVATCTWKPIVQGPNAIMADMNVNYYPNNVSSTSYITVSPRNSSR